MTHARRPSDETLLRYAAGSLGPGLSLVVAAHLETCPSCRARAEAFERLGGALLEQAPCAPLGADALSRTLDRLDRRAAVDHQPVVGGQSECVCLAALEGGMVMRDRLSRWLSPILGF